MQFVNFAISYNSRNCTIMKKTFFTSLVLFLMTINSLAQSGKDPILLKIYHTLNNLQSFSNVANYEIIMQVGDTIKMTTYYDYYKNDNDSILGYSFLLKDEKRNNRSIYDGLNMVSLDSNSKNYFIENIQKNPRRLSGLFSSPLSIKNVLKLCISTDSISYKVSKDKHGDYQLDISFPYFLIDSYTINIGSKTKNSSTNFTIIFDKQTLLPKYLSRENISTHGKQLFIAFFNNYKTIERQKIIAMNLIPADYHLYNQEKIEKGSIDKQAPNFKLKQLNGDSIELYKMKDKYILLEFSTLNCGGCIASTPLVVKMIKNLEGNTNILFVIDMQNHSNTKNLSEYIKKNNIDYPYLLDGRNIGSEYEISAIPTFILLDNNKKIIDMMIGFNEDRFRKMIEKRE